MKDARKTRAQLIDELAELRRRIAEQEAEVSGYRQVSAEISATNERLQQEVTERKKAEEALRESEMRLRTLVEHAPEAIAVFDADAGRFVDANENAARLFGLEREALFNVGPLEVSPPTQPDGRPSAEVVGEKIREALNGGTPVFEWVHQDASGDQILCEQRLVRLPAGGRNLVRVSMMDIAERKRTEQQMIRLERLRALGEMAAGVSHNLNNLLVGVLGYAELLQESTRDSEQFELAERIVRAAHRAADLVHRLSQSVRGKEEVHLRPVPVAEAVQAAIEEARPRWKDEAEAEGVSIEVVAEVADVPPVKGRPSGLRDVLVNLLFNAVDALPEGGRITLAARAAGDDVLLSVSDTGTGMDEETRRRVFEPFFTTKADVGSGLGLSTSYTQVTGWGGSIEVDSAPGRGTTFTLRLPVWTDRKDTKADAGGRPVSRKRILIVEDEVSVCTLLSRLLSRDHEVEVVTDGEAALARVAPDRYDVALIDLGIPRTPGNRVAERIQEVDALAVTVLITGWELQADDPRLAAFDLRLQKPFNGVSGIRQVVAQAVALHDSRLAQGPG